MKMKLSQYAKLNGVTTRTVWNWIYKGSVKCEKTPTNRTLIVLDNDHIKPKEPVVAVYSRVSSSENKQNLETQSERLISFANAKGYKVNKVIKEIGSGLNDNRPKLQDLLIDKNIDIILVEHKDRLTRFGFNYIEKLLLINNRKIEVVNNLTDNKEDLIQDFISIITSFCARIYGQRRSKRNAEKLIKELNETC
jgi:predicted site-specific integrase-resolvase